MNSLRINRNLIVTDIFDCVADNADSHVNQISRRHFKHRLGKLLAILIDLLQQRPTLSTLPHAYRRNISARNTIKNTFYHAVPSLRSQECLQVCNRMHRQPQYAMQPLKIATYQYKIYKKNIDSLSQDLNPTHLLLLPLLHLFNGLFSRTIWVIRYQKSLNQS